MLFYLVDQVVVDSADQHFETFCRHFWTLRQFHRCDCIAKLEQNVRETVGIKCKDFSSSMPSLWSNCRRQGKFGTTDSLSTSDIFNNRIAIAYSDIGRSGGTAVNLSDETKHEGLVETRKEESTEHRTECFGFEVFDLNGKGKRWVNGFAGANSKGWNNNLKQK